MKKVFLSLLVMTAFYTHAHKAEVQTETSSIMIQKADSIIDGKLKRETGHTVIVTTDKDINRETQVLRVKMDYSNKDNNPNALAFEVIDKDSKEFKSEKNRRGMELYIDTVGKEHVYLDDKFPRVVDIQTEYLYRNTTRTMSYSFGADVVMPIIWIHTSYTAKPLPVDVSPESIEGLFATVANNVKAEISFLAIRTSYVKPFHTYEGILDISDLIGSKIYEETKKELGTGYRVGDVIKTSIDFGLVDY